MKKRLTSVILALFILVCLTGCSQTTRTPPAEFATAQSVIDYMVEGNALYARATANNGNVSSSIRTQTAQNGQFPYAVVVTCSDSRVPPEHIFMAGVGELFVIRTAGNAIGNFALGSVEYGAEHLGSKVIMVLGHTQCGAVDAAMNGGAHGHIKDITDEIAGCLTEGCNAREAEILNVRNSIAKIRASEIISHLEENGAVIIIGAIYNISTGEVELLTD